jgi:hypothetical protein
VTQRSAWGRPRLTTAGGVNITVKPSEYSNPIEYELNIDQWEHFSMKYHGLDVVRGEFHKGANGAWAEYSCATPGQDCSALAKAALNYYAERIGVRAGSTSETSMKARVEPGIILAPGELPADTTGMTASTAQGTPEWALAGAFYRGNATNQLRAKVVFPLSPLTGYTFNRDTIWQAVAARKVEGANVEVIHTHVTGPVNSVGRGKCSALDWSSEDLNRKPDEGQPSIATVLGGGLTMLAYTPRDLETARNVPGQHAAACLVAIASCVRQSSQNRGLISWTVAKEQEIFIYDVESGQEDRIFLTLNGTQLGQVTALRNLYGALALVTIGAGQN